jgi:hypothetical protein
LIDKKVKPMNPRREAFFFLPLDHHDLFFLAPLWMDSRKIIFANGHFYDSNTGERIFFRNGSNLVVVGQSSDILPCPPAGNQVEPRSDNDLKAELKSKEESREIAVFQRLVKRGEHLYFRAGTEVSESFLTGQFVFKVRLLEELYGYQKERSNDGIMRLYDCSCVVEEILGREIRFFEIVYGKSLNELYKNTFVHYFWNYGSPTANVHDRFHTDASLSDESRIKNLWVMKVFL